MCIRDSVRAVDDVHQEIGQLDRLERRHEGVDEVVRQIRYETDRVGEQDRLTAGELALTGPGVERDEESVLGLHPGVRDGVQHGGLAGVGVTDKRDLTDVYKRQE